MALACSKANIGEENKNKQVECFKATSYNTVEKYNANILV